MKIEPQQPPRVFHVDSVEMKDCARIVLEPDEQVTFVTESGAEYDVARKSWGYYATPSLNVRLKRFGLRAALVRNLQKRFFVMLVEATKEADFVAYLDTEQQVVVTWLDSNEALMRLAEGSASE